MATSGRLKTMATVGLAVAALAAVASAAGPQQVLKFSERPLFVWYSPGLTKVLDAIKTSRVGGQLQQAPLPLSAHPEIGRAHV